MAIKTKSEPKKVTKRAKRAPREDVVLVITEHVVPEELPVVPEELPVVPEELPVVPEELEEELPVELEELEEELPVELEELPVEALAPQLFCGEELEGQLVFEEVVKCKKLRVLKEGKPLVNEIGEYLNPLTNRYVKVGTTLYKRLIKDGMICVVPV
jgi:hypothetical protein